MPLVRIDVTEGRPVAFRSAVGEVVYLAMTETLNVPKDDRFQVIAEHKSANFVIDPNFLGITRTSAVVVIQVTLNIGRTVEQKKAFYEAVANGLHQRVGLRKEDVFINLVEVERENWSLGNGVAQFAP